MPVQMNGISEMELSFKKEWLETNGIGGYASSSITGCHTRKYHGWLVSSLSYLSNKFVLLSKVDASILDGKKEHNLSLSRYSSEFYPKNFDRIKSFDIDSVPVTKYFVKELGVELEQSLMLLPGEDTLLVKYRLLKSSKPITLNLSPKFSYRMVHLLGKKNSNLDVRIHPVFEKGKSSKKIVKIIPYSNMPELFIASDSELSFKHNFRWDDNNEYLEEQNRGYEYHEDLFCVGDIEKKLKSGDSFYLRFSTNLPAAKIEKTWTDEITRRVGLKKSFNIKKDILGPLKLNGEKFLIENYRRGHSIVAGYPWANECARDAMVSLPGLTFLSGRVDKGLEILKTYARFEHNGLLPNCLPVGEHDPSFYNSVDSSLFFVWAVQEYYKATGDLETIYKYFFNTIRSIIRSYVSGYAHISELTPEGLIWSGGDHNAFTWMDSKINGQPVTSRHGYAVEVNALWFNTLSFYREIGHKKNIDFDLPINEIIKRLKKSFVERFWSDDYQFLADVVNEYNPDFSVRPNQIFAVSLPYSPLSLKQKVAVVKCVERELLTPYGLRTLSPRDPKYAGTYQGDANSRDYAYHQGTVWPWLIGHFTQAFLKVVDNKKAGAAYLKKYFYPLISKHVSDNGLLSISEIFDGNKPHTARGCIAQAWSVGEVIRAFELLRKES